MTIRNRITGHTKVRAGDLIPHPLNFRTHPQEQKDALAASFEEIGFARSLLGYTTADGHIQLIDGHLRREFDPDMEVDVELLDVTEEEARKLLLTIDPMAQLAQTDEEIRTRLTQITHSDSEALTALWSNTKKEVHEQQEQPTLVSQYLIVIECTDEKHQVALLRKLRKEALKCQAKIS